MTKIINGPINKKNDAMFKAIITSPNNREMVLDFIEAITNISKTILSKGVFSGGEEIPKRIITEKKQSVDVILKLNDKHRVILEMNQKENVNIIEKNTTYALSIIVETTHPNIKKYPKVVIINIDNFNKYKTKKPIIEFKMRDELGNIETEMYRSIHLVLENINNSKYDIDKEIKKFGNFLRSEKTIEELEKEYNGDEKYMAAVRTVKDLSRDPEFVGYYNLEEAHKQDLIAAEDYGIKKGYSKGIEKGTKEANIETAKKLLKMGLGTLEEISKATELSIEEIIKLKEIIQYL